MSTDLKDLQPDVMFKAQHALAELDAQGVPYVVTSTLRTTAEQVALAAQGNKSLSEVNGLRVFAGMRPITDAENKYTVTHADGVILKSRHQSGRALDVVPRNERGWPVWPQANDPRWQQISKAFKRMGFTWGGDWASFQDLPHYEIS